MISKGIIEEIISSKEDGVVFTVRVPLLETANETGEFTLKAHLSYQPGNLEGYSIGDIVYIGFENDSLRYPVILGKLYKGNEKNLFEDKVQTENLSEEELAKKDATNFSYNSDLEVINSAILPNNTKIGDLTYDDLYGICKTLEHTGTRLKQVENQAISAVTKEYVDTQDTSTLTAAKTYVDNNSNGFMQNRPATDSTRTIYGLNYSSVSDTNTIYHQIQLGFSKNDVLYFDECGGVFKFSKTSSGSRRNVTTLTADGGTIVTSNNIDSYNSAIYQIKEDVIGISGVYADLCYNVQDISTPNDGSILHSSGSLMLQIASGNVYETLPIVDLLKILFQKSDVTSFTKMKGIVSYKHHESTATSTNNITIFSSDYHSSNLTYNLCLQKESSTSYNIYENALTLDGTIESYNRKGVTSALDIDKSADTEDQEITIIFDLILMFD